jgi:hypothetical protein
MAAASGLSRSVIARAGAWGWSIEGGGASGATTDVGGCGRARALDLHEAM